VIYIALIFVIVIETLSSFNYIPPFSPW